jgi:hypothetical protein
MALDENFRRAFHRAGAGLKGCARPAAQFTLNPRADLSTLAHPMGVPALIQIGPLDQSQFQLKQLYEPDIKDRCSSAGSRRHAFQPGRPVLRQT